MVDRDRVGAEEDFGVTVGFAAAVVEQLVHSAKTCQLPREDALDPHRLGLQEELLVPEWVARLAAAVAPMLGRQRLPTTEQVLEPVVELELVFAVVMLAV